MNNHLSYQRIAMTLAALTTGLASGSALAQSNPAPTGPAAAAEVPPVQELGDKKKAGDKDKAKDGDKGKAKDGHKKKVAKDSKKKKGGAKGGCGAGTCG